MILLNQNITSGSSVYLTLSESTTLTGTTYYLFNFKSETTNENVLFTAPDTSTATTRYNLFQITLTGSTDVNLTAGTISLESQGEQGMYAYEIYQQTGQTNIALSGVTGGPIEYGIVTVQGDALTRVQSYYSGTSNTLKYYTPG